MRRLMYLKIFNLETWLQNSVCMLELTKTILVSLKFSLLNEYTHPQNNREYHVYRMQNFTRYSSFGIV